MLRASTGKMLTSCLVLLTSGFSGPCYDCTGIPRSNTPLQKHMMTCVVHFSSTCELDLHSSAFFFFFLLKCSHTSY